MSEVCIYHNPRCSKSRQTLAILQENNIDPTIILYLETPLVKAEIKKILSLLGIEARQLLRKSEQAYKDKNLSDPTLTNDALIDAMISAPILIERPIVLAGNKAVLGRPPENVLSII